jgi:hypothetical protein
MNILILAAGQNPVPEEEGYPLCLNEFDSVPLIQRVTDACGALNPKNLIVALREEDVRGYHLDNIVTLLWPKANILSISHKTQGAACTALLAVDIIDYNEELLIVSGNELLDSNFNEIVAGFRQRKLDAGTVIFHSIHPRYSYVRLNENEELVEAAEKRPISTNATVGFYWFARGSEFVRAAKGMIRKGASINDSYFVCPAFNELVLEHKLIGVHKVDSTLYHPLKTIRQVELFETAADKNPN